MSKSKRDRIATKTNWKCAYCGKELHDNKDLTTIDHINPRRDIPTKIRNRDANLFLCCRQCNSAKGDRSLEKFRNTMIRKTNNCPYFSQKQIDYLKSVGFNFNMKNYVFYFEEIGVEI